MGIESGPETSNQEEAKKEAELIEGMADSLHEDWRGSRRIENTDKFEPRWKPAKDSRFEEEWRSKLDAGEKKENIRIEGGKIEIDIANTPYKELTEPWKKENKASAEAAIKEVARAKKEKRPLDDNFIEEASSVIHDKWLERNGNWAPPEQNKPYAELTEEEKEKDRIYIRKAIEIIQS